MFLANKLNKGGSLGPVPDAQFNYVTMLLHGDGTNGAQNNTFVDSSTNNFTITRNGNTTQGSFSPYGSNWSNFFVYASPGTNYLVSNSLSLSGNFTIEGYVYWDGVGSNFAMFTLGDSFISTGIEVYSAGGNWFLYSDDAVKITGSAPVAGQWTYIAVTRSGTTVTMYINGVSQGTWTSSQTFSGTIKVGVEFYSSAYGISMSGYISNFRVNNTTAINAVPTAPLTAVSGTIFLTCQSNRFIDNSTNNYTITVNGPPSVQRFNPFGTSTAYSTSVIGGSMYSDGSGDILSIADNAALRWGTGDFCVETWINPPNVSGSKTIICKGTNNAGTFELDLQANKIEMYTAAFVFTSSASIVANAWTHVAVTRSGTTLRLFINGVLDTTVTSYSYDFNNTGTFYIGVYGNGGSNQYSGYLSDVRCVKGSAVYTSAFTPPTAPLTAITNTQLLTNFTNGAIFDNAMMNDLETVGNAQISTSVKKYGTGSMYFDGTGDYLQIPYSPNFQFGTGPYTIEFWINTTATDVWIMFNAATDTGIRVYITSTGKIQLNEQVSNADHTATSTTSINNGAWNHVAFSRASGQGTKLFINGVSEDQGGGVYNFNNTNTLYIGTRSSLVLFLNGYLDDFRITKGFARYTTTFTPPTAAFSDTGPI